jgi:hypothetical protein
MMHVALHEAAHAVVGVYLGFTVVSVSVDPAPASLGRVDFTEEPTGPEGVLVSLAGPAMNYELGLMSGIGCDADAFEALSALGDESDFRTSFMDALSLVQRYRPAIDAIALRTLTTGTIYGSEVRKIIAAVA